MFRAWWPLNFDPWLWPHDLSLLFLHTWTAFGLCNLFSTLKFILDLLHSLTSLFFRWAKKNLKGPVFDNMSTTPGLHCPVSLFSLPPLLFDILLLLDENPFTKNKLSTNIENAMYFGKFFRLYNGVWMSFRGPSIMKHYLSTRKAKPFNSLKNLLTFSFVKERHFRSCTVANKRLIEKHLLHG